MGDSLQNRVLRAYNTPGHQVAFSAPERIADYFGISQKKAKEILEHNQSYVLHREYKKPRVYNPYYVHGRRKLIQADLIDMKKIQAANDGITFLLVFIDVFTKKIWVYPLKNKNQTTMRNVFAQWINSLQTKPKRLQTDLGLEFTNNAVQTLLRANNIEWQSAQGTLKAAVVERVNKTLQILIYKYLCQEERIRYINVLQKLVETYNKRGHKTLQDMSPEDADKPENEAFIQGIFHNKYEKINKHRKTHLPFEVGDIVRVKTDPKKISSSSRAYAEQFHGEYFKIDSINRTLPIALYYLRSEDTGELIEGGFYAQEIQKQRGNVYRIESVLDRRVRRGQPQILVKWKYFGPRWNEWIPEENVQQAF